MVRTSALFLIALLLQLPVNAQQKGWFHRTGAFAQSSPAIADLNGDSRMEIVFRAYDGRLYFLNDDGTTYTSPISLGFTGRSISSPAIGNVDTDALPEIVVLGHDSSGLNSTLKIFDTTGNCVTVPVNQNASGKCTPCLIDCYKYDASNSRHDAREIVVRDGNGIVHVFYRNGLTYTDLTYNNAAFDTTTTDTVHDLLGAQHITPSVAAISIDSEKTYLATGSTDGHVYRWEITSTSNDPWVVNQLSTLSSSNGKAYFLSTPVIADLDQSNTTMSYEIVAADTDSKVYVWNYNGSLRSSRWPQTVGQAVVSSPIVANLDSDPELEILVGCADGGVYAWNADGTPVGQNSLLFETNAEIFGSVLVAEIDGQPGLEVVTGSMDGFLYAWHVNGTPLDGWPKRIGSPFYATPAIADLHHGGRQSIVSLSYDGKLYVFDLARKYNSTAGWKQFLGGPERNSSYQAQ